MQERITKFLITALGVALCLFTLFEVNYNQLQPQSALALFVMIGLVLCFLVFPIDKRLKDVNILRYLDLTLAAAVVVCCGYVIVQTEPLFKSVWAVGISLGNRAAIETTTDFVIGAVGLILVIEATRRSIGWIVPILALLFVGHSYYCYASYSHN